MGLDGVELVMEIEDRFGVVITDAEASQFRTVGDVVGLLNSRIEAAKSGHCATLAAFLSLRGLVRDVVGDAEFSVRPKDAVAAKLSTSQRRRLWRQAPKALEICLEPLRAPRMIRATFTANACLIVVAAVAAGGPWANDFIPPVLLVFLGALLLIASFLAVQPFRTVPPESWSTFGAIARQIARKTAASNNLHLRDDESILAELRPILTNVLGVAPDRVTADARLVEDLGLA